MSLHKDPDIPTRLKYRCRSGQSHVVAILSLALTALNTSTLPLLAASSTASLGALQQAEGPKNTVTWHTTSYSRITSEDGKRMWLETEVQNCAYKAPGLYRTECVDKEGKVISIDIVDAVRHERLELSPEKRRATLRLGRSYDKDPRGPFVWAAKRMEENLEWLGERTVAGHVSNGFRHALRDYVNHRDWSYDFWIDAKTKHPVAIHDPGADVFHAAHQPDSNNLPQEARSTKDPLGSVHHDIVFGAELDDSLFSLTPPDDYTVTRWRRPEVTEAEMIEYLGVLAAYHDNTFPDPAPPAQPFPPWHTPPGRLSPVTAGEDRFSPPPVPIGELSRIREKSEKERTPAERTILITRDRYDRLGPNMTPITHFVAECTKPGSWQYLGKGVRLGDKDRIVCWYRRTDSTYRMVLGDLSVTDVAPEDLPFHNLREQFLKAKTVTFTVTSHKPTTKDGRRNWARRSETRYAYKSPGQERMTMFDKEGQVSHIVSKNVLQGKGIQLNVKERKAEVWHSDTRWISQLKELGISTDTKQTVFGHLPNNYSGQLGGHVESIGKKRIAGEEANGFRVTYFHVCANKTETNDLWIDANTQRLMLVQTPGADMLDPDFPEEEWSRASCRTYNDIVLDPDLDDSLFSLDPPEGYTVTVAPPVQYPTDPEEMVIQYFRLLAEAFDGRFPDVISPIEHIDRKRISKYDPDGAPGLRKLRDFRWELIRRGGRFGGDSPFNRLHIERAVAGSWRYLGKGATLGEKDRIIYWYRPKDSSTYRVVYADMSVRDVAPENLPLPVRQ